MKIFILVFFGFVAAAKADYFCTADGYNSQNQLLSVSGKTAKTLKDAEESAVMTCRMHGYAACRVQSCFEI